VFGLLRHLSARDLAARPYRVVTFVFAIALGVALVTAMQVSTDAVVRHFNAQVARVAGGADLQITFGTGETGFPEDIVSRVQAEPYVARAVAVVRGALRFVDGSDEVLELFGVDLLDDDVNELYGIHVLDRTADDFTIINDPYAVFLPEVLASERKLAVGDSIQLATVTGVHQYTVRGIFAGPGIARAYDGRLAAMYLPAAQGVLGLWRPNAVSIVDQIDISLVPGVGVGEGAARIARILPPSLTVAQPEQRQLANRRLVAGLRATLVGISVFALLAAMFIVYSTTAALVTYRMPVLGALVVAGASPNGLFRLVLFEAAVLGAVGGLIGTGIGLVMARFAMGDAAVGLSLNYSMDFAPLGRVLDLRGDVALLPLVGCVAAVASAYFPARRLCRLDPLSLQRVGLVDEYRTAPMIGVALAAVAACVGGCLALTLGVRGGSPTSSAAGTTLLSVAALLFGLPVVRYVWLALRGPMHRMAGTSGWISIEQLNRNTERSLITVAAIALSIGVVLAASTLPRSFRRSVVHWYGFYGDAIVASRSHQGGWLKAPTTDSYEGAMAKLQGVARVETFRVLQGQMYRGERVAVAALSDGYVDRALGEATAFGRGDRTSATSAIRRGVSAAISENMARHYGLAVSDEVELESPGGPIVLPVVAVVPDFISDRGSILLGRDLVRKNWHDRLVNYFAVFLAPGTTVGDFRRALTRSVGNDAANLSVLSLSALVSEIDDAIAAAFADIAALQLLVIAITIAGIVDLVVSNVLDRRRLHAVLRVAGTSDRGILQIVACEGGLIGLTAGLVGIVVGCLASWTWIRFTYPVLVGYVLRLNFAWINAILCLALASGTAVVAGTVAGYTRLRESPVDAVRAE
jgi:putative ABC transport system permease protein